MDTKCDAKENLLPEDRYVFIHIGKSAGTAIREAIAKQFCENEVCPVFFPGQISELNEKELNQYKFISAHIGYDQAAPLSSNLFTVLRNPFDRVISLYYYWKEIAGDEGGPIIAKQLSFEDFIESTDASVIVDMRNTQTWQLAHGHQAFVRQEFRSQYSEDQLLKKAIDNLENLKVVGLQENIPKFIDDINAVFGWNVEAVNRSNATSKRPTVADVPVALKRKLYKYVELDLELYFYALKRFGFQRSCLTSIAR